MNAAIPALAEADELSGIGEMSAGVMESYAQMVCDNEIAASINRLRRGFPVNDDSLGVEVIAAAKDGSRNFLGLKQSVKYLCAGEILFTQLTGRRPWEGWAREWCEGMAQ